MVLFMDGCSHYATAQIPLKWTAMSTAASGTTTYTIENDGRTDGCIKRVSDSGNQSNCGFLTYTPLFTQDATWTPSTTGRIGFAIKVDDLARIGLGPTGPSAFNFGQTLLQVMYAGVTSLGFALTSAGVINVYRKRGFGSSPLLGSSVQAVTSDTWTYIEIEWVLSTSGAGTVVIRSNNTEVLNLSGLSNTYDGAGIFANGPALWNSLEFLNLPAAGGTLTLRVCDIYVADGAAPNGSFLGDISVAYYKPEGVGAVSGWTPTAGSNWECVDGVPPNGSDTPSVSATTPNTRDSYVMEDVVGDPRAIQICMFCRKTEEAGAGIKPAMRIGGVYYDSPNEQGLSSTSYQYKLQCMDVNPANSSPWTKTVLDAAESGPLKSS